MRTLRPSFWELLHSWVSLQLSLELSYSPTSLESTSTWQSLVQSVSSEALTATDELELASLGEKKVALFALIPDHDVSFNFLVSMVYSCTFEQLFRLADDKYKGALPVPVHFLMDEFANVSLPDDFDKLLATMRSRNVFVSIIIQNIAQLKNLFEKQWESILGNCDEFLYLGGNETGTHKMIAESYLGKQTPCLWHIHGG